MKKIILLSIFLLCISTLFSQNKPTQNTPNKGKFTTVAVKTADLNKNISNYIKKEYQGYTIQTSSKLLKNGAVFKYKIEIIKDEEKKTLMFSKDYKFIEELESKGNKPDKVSPTE